MLYRLYFSLTILTTRINLNWCCIGLLKPIELRQKSFKTCKNLSYCSIPYSINISTFSSEQRMREHQRSQHMSPGNLNSNDKRSTIKDNRETKARRNEWRITKMVLAIFLSFLVCYLPITIAKVADNHVHFPGKRRSLYINNVTWYLLATRLYPSLIKYFNETCILIK